MAGGRPRNRISLQFETKLEPLDPTIFSEGFFGFFVV